MRIADLVQTMIVVAALSAPARGADLPAGLKVDRAVVVMRHGVRPPTKMPPVPAGIAAQPWPVWQSRPGWLTPHGAQAVAAIGRADRHALIAAGLLPKTGCAGPGKVRAVADSDQRTIASADAWLAAVQPGCVVASEHAPTDQDDPRFHALDTPVGTLDPARADAEAVAAIGPGGIAALEARYRPLLARLNAVLCGGAGAGCGVNGTRTRFSRAEPHAGPGLEGALDRASTVAQILLLEYAEGLPMRDVGWGRVTPGDIADFSQFHALEYRIAGRPPYAAAKSFSGLAPIVDAVLGGGADAATVTMISGHDTDVANLAGLLGVHWQVPGLAPDDPVPGGAIILERLHDVAGKQYVRAVYRSQTLAQIRSLAEAPPYRMVMPIAGCTALGQNGLCSLAEFRRRLAVPQ